MTVNISRNYTYIYIYIYDSNVLFLPHYLTVFVIFFKSLAVYIHTYLYVLIQQLVTTVHIS